jgi:hypothetical protein
LVEAVQAWAGLPTQQQMAEPLPFPRSKSCCRKAYTEGQGGCCCATGMDMYDGQRRSTSESSRPRQPTRKCNCPWGIWIEQCQEGWTTVEMPNKARKSLLELGATHTVATIHNHALLQTVAEIITNACQLEEHTRGSPRPGRNYEPGCWHTHADFLGSEP